MKRFFLSGFVLFILPFGAWAAEENLYELSLEDLLNIEIGVTSASKRLEKIAEAPAVISVVTAEEIALFGGQDLGDVLSRMLGVQTHNTHVNGVNFIGIRSDQPAVADNSHVLVLLNGSAFSQDSYNGGIFNNANTAAVPINAIARIELIRGPGSVLHGSKAFQGIINIVTKDREDDSGSLAAGRGQMDTEFYKAEVSIERGDFSLMVKAMRVNTDGPELTWSAGGTINRLTENMIEDNFGVLLTTKYKNIKATMWYGETDQGSTRINPIASEVVRGYWRNKKYFANLAYDKELNKHWKLSTKLALNGHRSGISLWQEDGGPEVEYESDDQSIELNLMGELHNGSNLLLGSIVSRLTGATPGAIAPVEDWQDIWWSLYAQYDYQVKDWMKLTLGGQYNKTEENSKFVPRLGSVMQFTPTLGMKLLYGEAYRSPTTAEKGVNIPAINLFGNPSIKPETIQTVDIQFYYHKDSRQAALTFFRSRQRDLITRFTSDAGIISFRNEGEVTIKGIELEGKSVFYEDWFFTGGLSYQTNRDSNNFKNFTMQPNWEARLGLGYTVKNFSLGFYDIYKGAYQEATLREPSYADLNPSSTSFHNISLNMTLQLSAFFDSGVLKKSSVIINASNLLNKEVFLPTLTGESSANTAPAEEGRAIFVEFKFVF